jgi:hypothetical protein
MTYIAHTARPPTTNDEGRAKESANARFGGRTPLFRAPLASPSEPQPHYNELLTPVSAQRAFFGPLAPLMPPEPPFLSHNQANDADLLFVRHLRPFRASNFLTISSLSLCPKKSEISGSLRHPSVRHPRSPPAFPTTHNPQPTPNLHPAPVQTPLTLGGVSYIY